MSPRRCPAGATGTSTSRKPGSSHLAVPARPLTAAARPSICPAEIPPKPSPSPNRRFRTHPHPTRSLRPPVHVTQYTPHPRRPRHPSNWSSASTPITRRGSGVEARRPRIPHDNGAARGCKCPRRGHAADSGRTPGGHFADTSCPDRGTSFQPKGGAIPRLQCSFRVIATTRKRKPGAALVAHFPKAVVRISAHRNRQEVLLDG